MIAKSISTHVCSFSQVQFFSTASLKLGKGKGGVEESMSSSLLSDLSAGDGKIIGYLLLPFYHILEPTVFKKKRSPDFFEKVLARTRDKIVF
jgi:hypothetical protein